MIIDTHCHYNLEPLWENWAQHWQQAQDAGVTQSVVIGTTVVTSQRALTLAHTNANLYAAVGVHPTEYQTIVERSTYTSPFASEWLTAVEKDVTAVENILINHSPHVVALGEVGLDYFRVAPEHRSAVTKLQTVAFVQYILLAEKYHVPLIIHVRDQDIPETPIAGNAYWDVLSLLRQYHQGKQPFILHCVSGPTAYIQAALDLGAYLGIAGNITYKSADHLRAIIRNAPITRLLLETDAPYLPPQNYRGQICLPAYIRHTAEYVHQELGINLSQLKKNAQEVFNL